MIQIKQFKIDEHYEILEGWWKKQDFTPISIPSLSQTGLIAYKDNQPLASGFLYDTDSAWALIEWIVGNPDSNKDDRREAVGQVIEGLIVFAELKGKKLIHTITKHENLMKTYVDHGFIKADQVTEFVRRL